MKKFDTQPVSLLAQKRDRPEADKIIAKDKTDLKRPKPEDSKVYQSLFTSHKQAASPKIGDGGDFMTRCAKWGLQ
jgi:hypothetical protein